MPQPAQTDKQTDQPIAVRATAVGIFAGIRREPGQEFTIDSADQLGSWMEPVAAEERKRFASQLERLAKIRPPAKPMNGPSVPPTPVYARKPAR